ncbi:MAG: 23S rRNA (uracil-5-)-methyltransferase RumA [Bacteroidetes bacterium RIFCSPLOWO2_02_FULL_36_8]|nr:MAG: 23S rRNA (uracil-5-)-methyltransferase RumA [Bacteroidetes bacterium RIFCSPLOWO2_02_FULL_36_8]OFY71112.1 MAG: 23S rRNA (uracil-5-)-methyltransferase RumA [Bacteroidetes bacterium RIFCSPLOWO2_12_FULL_37_12]
MDKSQKIFENIPITSIGSEGYAIAKIDNKVIFVENAIPGDTCDIRIYKNKKKFAFAEIKQLNSPSPDRVTPVCEHFGPCGGCRWQNLSYQKQLYYKQNQVQEQFEHIGGFSFPPILPILPSPSQTFYRNKMEYTFSHRSWLTEAEWNKPFRFCSACSVAKPERFVAENQPTLPPALGFHLPGRFDQVLDINTCHLQADPSNQIRNAVKKFAIENHYSFYDLRQQTGFLRNLIIRISGLGNIMVIIQFYHDDEEKRVALLEFLKNKFPEINSLQYIINPKPNETFLDQEVVVFSGSDCIYEMLHGIKFKIKPKTFFQTNSYQAQNLVRTAIDFCEFQGDEILYDLYTGTGAIALTASSHVKKVIGIESVDDSVKSAIDNADLNQISNVKFVAGTMENIFTKSFLEENGRPDVIITDPPRTGMSPGVVEQLMDVAPAKIVYVSCNPATQARDLKILCTSFTIKKIQPVDMFPQTHHVENVVLLDK